MTETVLAPTELVFDETIGNVAATCLYVSSNKQVIELHSDGSVILDRPAMVANYPYSFWIEDVFLVALKRADDSVEFFSVQ
jgi:hypothetical protein